MAAGLDVGLRLLVLEALARVLVFKSRPITYVELPRFVLEALERKSGGGDLVAYLVELLGKELDPEDRAAFYVESSEWFWEEGTRLLEKGDYRQAGEKIWNSVVQAVKAVAERRGWRHDAHRLVWAALRRIAQEAGDATYIKLFAEVEQLHQNFYEGHLDEYDVRILAESARELRGRLLTLIQSRG